MTADLEVSRFQKRPAYRYIRAADGLPATSAVNADSLALVKLFNPTGAGTWYLAGYDPQDRVAWGLADLGMEPEYGCIGMEELVEFRGRFGLPIERDLHWTPRPLRECGTR